MRSVYHSSLAVFCMRMALVAAVTVVAAPQPLRGDDYSFTLIADTSTFQSFNIGRPPSISEDSNAVAFHGLFSNEPSGIFVGRGGETRLADYTTIARSGPMLSVDSPGAFVGSHVAFSAYVGPAQSQQGYFRGNGMSPHETMIIDPGVGLFPAPPPMNASGTTALLRQLGSGETAVTKATNSVPTTLYATAGNPDFQFVRGGLDINDGGQVLFGGQIRDGLSGLLRGSGGGLTLIASENTSEFPRLSVDYPALVALNDNGQAAFIATFRSFEGNTPGVYSGNGGPLTTVAISTPGGFQSFSDVAINDNGMVAFRANLGFNPIKAGIFTGDDPIADKVIAIGDSLFGSTVTSVDFHRYGLNNLGQVAFQAILADGRTVIARADPPTDIIRWKGPDPAAPGGAFGTASNWQPEQVPVKSETRSDIALFDLDQDYTVSVDGERTVERLVVRDGRATFSGDVLTAAALSSCDPAVLSPCEPSVTVEGDGRLNVVDGRLRSVHAVIGNTPPPDAQNPIVAEVLISNDLTDWIASGNIAVGRAGKGRLFVANGAEVTSAAATIGGQFGGEATVGGDGSKWRIGNLAIGTGSAAGILNIEAGGLVDSDAAVIGNGTGLGSRVTVSGLGSLGDQSQWTVSDALKVGGAGSGRLEVTAGGVAVAVEDIEIATQAAATGAVVVSGAGSPGGIPLASKRSTLSSVSNLRVGRGGVGELTVEGGALAGFKDVFIGDLTQGTVTVRGTLPSASVPTSLRCDLLAVGDLDHGRLVIEGGAQVISEQGRVGSDAAPSGDTTSGEVFIRGAASGTTPASVWQARQKLDVGIDVESAGRITLEGGELLVNGTLTVGPRGELLGIGFVFTADRVINGGRIAPGLSPGKLTIDGDYEQLADGVLQIEIGGSSAGMQHDQLVVSGSIIANGMLDIHVVNAGNGFQLPNIGEELMLLNAGGGVSGTFQNSASLRSVAGGSLVDWSLTPGGNMFMLRATAITRLPDGDYNGNGVVDAADYVVWRQGTGGINLAADGNRDGIIDQLDYNVWRSQFGAGNAGAVGGAIVPEPATTTLLTWAVASCFVVRRSLSRLSKTRRSRDVSINHCFRAAYSSSCSQSRVVVSAYGSKGNLLARFGAHHRIGVVQNYTSRALLVRESDLSLGGRHLGAHASCRFLLR